MTQGMLFADLHNMSWWDVDRLMQPRKWDQTVFTTGQVSGHVLKQTGNRSIYSMCTLSSSLTTACWLCSQYKLYLSNNS